MNDFLEKYVKRIWLSVSVTSLLLPLLFSLLASQGYEETINFGQFMTVVIGVLLVATLPTSLFVLPFLAVFKYILELEPDSLFPVYLYLGVLNIVGFVQWFKIMPAFFGTSKQMTLPTILEN